VRNPVHRTRPTGGGGVGRWAAENRATGREWGRGRRGSWHRLRRLAALCGSHGVDNGLASVVFLAIPDFTRGAGVLKVSQRGGGT
jgi:hypothetical protein